MNRNSLPEHSNWLCMNRIDRILRRLMSRLHDPYCNCQMEPWNRLTREEIKRRQK